MKKRTSLKVLLSASIICSIMIPFSFSKVGAENHGWYWEIGPASNGYLVNSCHFTMFLENMYNGSWVIKIKQPTAGAAVFSFALVETDGVTSVTRSYDSNTRYYTITINFDKCTWVHYLISVGGSTSDLWTTANLKNPQGQCNVSTTLTLNYGYQNDYNTRYQLSRIQAILSSIQNNGLIVDTSGIITELQTMIDNQEDIKELLEQQVNGSQETETSVGNNEQNNENLQTEQENYEQLEQQFNSDFDNNLNDINVSDWTTRLTGWSTGVTWLKTQMNTMFNSMGDYKYMLEIGMILAIALIFIGR